MKIARKIYYDLATGNVIQEIGEREGSVRETTFEEDYQAYKSLSEINPSKIGVIQLALGQYREKFGVYAYHIDLVTNDVVFDPTPIQIEQALIIKTQEQKIYELEVNQAMIQEVLDILIMGGA